MAMIFSSVFHGAMRPMRGSLPMDEHKDWPYGSRQVRRAAMRRMYFNHFSHLDVPRRRRRAMAVAKMHRVYRETMDSMLQEHGTCIMTKRKTWFDRVSAAFKTLVGKEAK